MCLRARRLYLYTGADVPEADGVSGLAIWNGRQLTAMQGGPIPATNSTSIVRTLEVVDSSNGPGLFLGGDFSLVDENIPSRSIARLSLCPDDPADLNNDGSVDGTDLGLLLGAWG